MAETPLLIVVLAAGMGTRMRSARPKVLHEIAGRSMLAHVLALATSAQAQSLAVVIGPGMDDVRQQALRQAPHAQIFVQDQQMGTADAVLAARAAIAAHQGDVVVLYADTPLIEAETLNRLRERLDAGAHVAVLGFMPADPTGYGRLLQDAAGQLVAIREEKDANSQEMQIRLCNSGVMAFRVPQLADLLGQITNDNAKGEFYLTDAVALCRAAGHSAAAVVCPQDEVLGVNARDQLATAESIWQRRARRRFMDEGVTMTAPETVWLSFDTVIGRDVTIQPNVFFGPNVVVGDNVEILANCHFQGARIGNGVIIGPFARLRPGAALGAGVRIGNFVEVKNSSIEDGAKANHLAYIGDARVGVKANIGAGTIVCNYDGFFKHKTDIGAGVFIGSNSSLVAPVTIGEGAYVGSGSVITKNVAANALALERSAQDERPEWAAKFRALMAKRKAKG